jgi:predicted phosphodiesterase
VRYLILSDIHGNWEALEAVFADSRGQYDRVLNCGDLVGYGPDPDRVVEFCREHCDLIVRGNHDKAVSGIGDLDWFNPVAKRAALWSRANLTAANLEYLAAVSQGPIEVDQFAVMHGSPSDEDDYLIDPSEARIAAATASTGLSFFGHTHLQGGFFIHRHGSRAIPTDSELRIEETATYLVNPGSVGQPRDGDPRAAYAIYDSDVATVFFRRARYAISETHRKIVAAGLPEVLGTRLYQGL